MTLKPVDGTVNMPVVTRPVNGTVNLPVVTRTNACGSNTDAGDDDDAGDNDLFHSV